VVKEEIRLKSERSDGADAFIPESAQIRGTSDDLAELLAEQYLREASGDDSEEGARDDVVPEELGGPFVESSPDAEFGETEKEERGDHIRPDGTNRWAGGPTRNPLPQAVGPLAIPSPDEDPEDQMTATERDVTAKYSISQTMIEENR
jgi:hypothetical protein